MRQLSLPSLIAAVSATSSHRQITQLHQHLLSHGLLSPFHTTKILHLYASSRDLHSSRLLFSSLPFPPSVYAWTSLLSLLSRLHLHHECFSTYSLLRASPVPPDKFVFPPVLRSAASLPQFFHLVIPSLHADSIKFGADIAIPVANALLSAHARCGNRDVAAARKVFDLMPEWDLLSWNSMISAYVSAGLIEPAVDLVAFMRASGCEPDLVTCNTLISGYCQAGRCKEALAVLDQLPNRNIMSWTAVISGFARCSDHDLALQLFRQMMLENKVQPDSDLLSSVISSSRYMSAFCNGQEAHAYGVKTMYSEEFYYSAGPALVTIYAPCGKISAVESLFRLMDLTDVVAWNAMIKAYVQLNLHESVFHYFREMQLKGFYIDETTIVTVLPVCDLNAGKQIYGYVMTHYGRPNSIVSNALISMYSRTGCIEAARIVFSNMQMKDTISWNTMIGAYASQGLGHQALALVRLMSSTGGKPDTLTLTSALMACTHCGLFNEGLELFEQFVNDKHVTPTMEQYACVVDLLSRAGRFHDALEVISKMPVRPNATVWGALLASCRLHNNLEFARVAFEQLVLIEPSNPGNYITMSNIYTNEGRLKEAAFIRKMIEKRDLVKPSGCSEVLIASPI
ncbi:Pentatricopeptide repeat-containing protein [Rhynchospora pubera]|uniref:Pentatricopeptide repeat-containing protein n=1 Tax=Rhynchospora pubera TaxID=906938 RepID=A0AAV8HSP9_9POAL|nr:Pentatricopeptide repeat-containing protein [Rhynchospora pubera]